MTLLTERTDEVVTLTINRPEALNALSTRVLTELRDFLTADLGGVRGIILTGAGDRAFLAGADIREMAAMDPDQGEAFGRLAQEVTLLLERLPIPVIACVNGYALGGGCELALACDFAYAVESAVFGQPEVSLGLIPGFGGCVRLQRVVGPARARELIDTGRRIPAAEALELGLVNAVLRTVPDLLKAAHETLREIAERSSVAVGLCKQAINSTYGLTTAAALERELSAFRSAFTSDDMRAGTAAFLAKRPPEFPGRPIT